MYIFKYLGFTEIFFGYLDMFLLSLLGMFRQFSKMFTFASFLYIFKNFILKGRDRNLSSTGSLLNSLDHARARSPEGDRDPST